ncbi:MAG: glycosyltransferase [Deltaproteobacteria bacterium]|nr:glycosyltransferase [Deltaproteobacteria bacterium]
MPDTWHLAHVITQLDWGGAQLATLYQIEHVTFPHGRRFLLHGPGGSLPRGARQLKGVESVVVGSLRREIHPLNDARALAELTRVLRRLRREHKGRWLVHTHSSKAGILGRAAARLSGVDCVVHTIHGFGHQPQQGPLLHGALLNAERAVARITHAFTADSAANIAQARRQGIIRDQPARVVRCGIDVARHATPRRARDQTRRLLGIGLDAQVVVTFAALKPQKDPESRLRVAAQVVREQPAAVFLGAGDGELGPRVEELRKELALEAHVQLLGWRDDAAELLHAADLLLLTSLWEGLPQAFPQAMAARLPIVATAVDGAPEAIEHGASGFLCPPGDVHALARSVIDLLRDGELRQRMGERGRARVHEFAQEAMVEHLDALYVELAQHGGTCG